MGIWQVSYLTILVIAGVSFFTSCFILCGAIARENLFEVTGKHKQNATWSVVLATLSPLFSAAILVFPLEIDKSSFQLGMIPRDQPVVVRTLLKGPQYAMKFFNCFPPEWSAACHRGLHFFAIVTGLAFGFITIIYHLATMHLNTQEGSSIPSFVVLIIGVVISVLCCGFFVFAGILSPDSTNHERSVMFMEYLGLFFYLITMIFTSIIAGDVITLPVSH